MMILNRPMLQMRVGEYLKGEYVALLGQSSSGMQTFINTLVNGKSPISGMNFAMLLLPNGIEKEDEFLEILLERLMAVIEHIPPEGTLQNKVLHELEQYKRRTVAFRLRKVLDKLGWETQSKPLVLVLQSLAHTQKKPLKSFLYMLRDYHQQIKVKGAPGEHLRFLVVGDVQLWKLCCKANDDESPFNIAKRIFLDDFSHQELVAFDKGENSEVASYLWSLTRGIPVLIEKVFTLSESFDGLFPFFEILQDHWNSLPDDSKNLLIRLSQEEDWHPTWYQDFQCPQIPDVESPWQEAFWKGFLSIEQNKIVWHSPIHRAFVANHIQGQTQHSINTLAKVDLLDLSMRIEKVLQLTPSKEYQHKQIADSLSLTHLTPNSILSPILEMIWNNEKHAAILEKLSQVATTANNGWMKDLQEKIMIDSTPLVHLLIDAAIWENRRSQGDFDIFLCHNNEDKTLVKDIAERLLLHGILPWLDEWELRPGLPWQPILEQQMGRIKTAAVFIGIKGLDPWQREELDVLLNEVPRRGCIVIPVILPNAPSEVDKQRNIDIPVFLKNRTWVDFRKNDPEPTRQLIWGITGIRNFKLT